SSANFCAVTLLDAHAFFTYPVGSTSVTWTSTDVHGNSSSCTQLVTVVDNEAPAISCSGDVTVNNDLGKCSADVTLAAPSSSDNCGAVTVVSNHASDTYPF